MLEHGGRLLQLARRTGTEPADWLDLSTGINPRPWPVPPIPPHCWSRLPENEDGLNEVAALHYGTHSLLPVAGTQAAIQLLPQLRPDTSVAVVTPTYAEHAHSWRQQGHRVTETDFATLDEELERFDVVILVNPNNPTGAARSTDRLLEWRQRLNRRGGWLIVDEAFIDCTPTQTLITKKPSEGLIILRSFGKFFGCPGARLGFVIGSPELIEALGERAGPWTVGAATRWLANQALQDRGWQEKTRERLVNEGERLASLLSRYGLEPSGGTALFQWCETDSAADLHHHLLNQRILTRLFSTPASLRFGLPGEEDDWERLEMGLKSWCGGLTLLSQS